MVNQDFSWASIDLDRMFNPKQEAGPLWKLRPAMTKEASCQVVLAFV